MPKTPLLEIFIRGTLVYLAVFVLLRVVFKRQSGTLGITDLIVIVFIADASQNALADDYRSVPDGLLLVATIVGWAFALDWAAYRFRAVERLIKADPLLLVKDGQMLREHMRRELLTAEELMSHLRLHGVHDLREVKEAYMEPNGQISVVSAEGLDDNKPPERLGGGG
ncbi:MAG: DUF421 domain-containing protein [Actinomycetota bacterium]|nr:DUF421 domain-containing protein [Actinomycetota bacterium]